MAILVPEYGRKFFLVESGMLGFGIRVQLMESGIPLTIRTHDPSFTDKDSGLKSGIQIVKSRIPDCLGLTYIGRYAIYPVSSTKYGPNLKIWLFVFLV